MIFNKTNNGTEEISAIATWTANHDYEHIAKALELAKRKLIFIIGKKTYLVGLAHYQSDNYLLAEQTAEGKILDGLIALMQTVLVNFAYRKNINKDTVLWDNSGIKVNWSDEFRPAQENTLDKLSEALDSDAYEFLDLLIVFLNENKAAFADFQKSIEALKLSSLFIDDAEDFNFYHNIDNSVSYFYELLSIIRRVQTSDIKNSLGLDYYAKVLDYQQKRTELEAITSFVTSVDALDPAAADNTVCIVDDLDEFWKFTSSEWKYYAYHPVLFLSDIKTALVNYTVYYKELENISKLKGRPDQIALLRANTDSLKKIADTAISQISTTITELKAEVEAEVVVEPETVSFVSISKNSISI